ncbi:MAG: hypothetical protein IJC65_07200 [Oscillospiraceae bacterium]|nr:hypothetical protein [Oscillospiraceae bacterium]
MDEKDPREKDNEMPENQNTDANENNEEQSEADSFRYVVLAMSLILWGYLIYIGMKNGITTSIRRGQLDLYSFVHPIGDIWFDAIGRNVLLAFLLIVFAAYPIYYFIDKRSKKKAAKEKLKSETKETDNPLNDEDSTDRSKSEDNETELIDERKRKKRFIWFALSFIPYLFILWSGIFGIDFWGDKYGFPAMIIVAGLLSLVPVYPVLLIFQIMFYIFSVRSGKFGEKQKRGTRRIVLVLICATLVIGIGHAIKASIDESKKEKAGRIYVEQYLAEEYGENYDDMEILDYRYGSYKINTPLLKKGYFYVHLHDSNVYDGTTHGDYGFKEVFQEENDLEDVLNNYVIDTYLGIYDCKIHSVLFDYDFRKFLDGDIKGFAESCKFAVHFVCVYEDKYDRENLVEIAKELCDGFCSDLPRYSDDVPTVRFIIDGERAYDAIISNRDYEIVMHVSEYREGSSRGYEEVCYNCLTDEITVTPINPK